MAPEGTPRDGRRPPAAVGRPPAADGRASDGGRRDGRLPYGRRRRTAASALVAMLVAFCLGALFNAPAMKRTALEQPFGAGRSFRLALVDPLAVVSHWLYLDRPAKLTAAALGRPDPGLAGGTVAARSGGPGDGRLPLQQRPLPKPFQGHPMHLYIAGDSMMGLPGMALVNLSSGTKLIKPLLDYRISTGLVRPDAFDWPARLQQQVKVFHPGAVALMFGANDNQGVQTASGAVYRFGSAGWKEEYRRRVQDVVDLLFRGGVRRIYWIGQPIMPSASFNDQIKLVNDVYRSVAAKNIGVRYIDAYDLLANGRGQYSQYLPDASGEMQQVRESDGEHITYAGGLRVAQAVMDAIRAEWLPKEGGATPPAKPTKSATPAP
jgi:uncharacterized protein